MAGLVDTLRDATLIAKTDKRVWAAAAFLFVVIGTWAATGSWREAPPEKEKVVREEKEHEVRVDDLLAGFQKDLDENREHRAQLGDILKRTENDVQATQEKVDSTFSNLISKLDGMSTRMDQLAEKFGTQKLEDANLNKKIEAHSKKKKTAETIKKGDAAEL